MNEVFSETGHSLFILRNVILHEWEVLVREVIKSAKHSSSIILHDHIPEILDQLEAILRDERIDEAELGKSHGYFRATLTNFSMADLLTEYSLLREVLLTYLYPMGSMECAKVIHKYIDIISKYSVIEYLNGQITHRTLSLEASGDESTELERNPVMKPKEPSERPRFSPSSPKL